MTVVSADFDGDGLLDVLMPGGEQRGLALMFGTVDGGLREGDVFVVGQSSEEGPLVAADVNGDGLPDVLYVVWDGGYALYALVNQGAGLLLEQPTPIVGTEASSIYGMAVGDVDGDGAADVVAVEYSVESALPDSGIGIYAFFGFADGGGSGTPVLLAAVPFPADSSNRSNDLFLTDLNEDGLLDIGFASYGASELALFLQQADGGFLTELSSFPSPIAAAALVPRAGAAPDIAVAFVTPLPDGGSVQILWNAGNGSFSPGPTYDPTNVGGSILVGDFNGDCLPDLAVSSGGCGLTEGVSVLYGDSDGGFDPPQSLQADAIIGMTLLGRVENPSEIGGIIVCGYSGTLRIYGDPTGP